MPLFTFHCPKCDNTFRKMLSKFDKQHCPKPDCGGEGERVVNPPTSQTREVIDNDLMPRRVERLRDINQLVRDRNDAIVKREDKTKES